MAMYTLAVFTAAQRTAIMAITPPPGTTVDPRAIDAPLPGVGLNINPDAVGFAPGATVTLVGRYIMNVATIQSPSINQAQRNYIQNLPWATLDSDVIFIPPEV